LFVSFPLVVFVVLFLCLGCLVGSPFLLLLYLLCDHCRLFWVLGSGSLGGFLLVFLVLGKVGVFPLFLLLLYLVFVVFICFLNILSCYQVGSLVRLC